MGIGIISLISEVHSADVIEKTTGPILDELKASFDLKEIDETQIEDVDLPVIFVKTGGTENKFIQIAALLKKAGKPVTLLSYGSNNSLPASLEILNWLNLNGFKNSAILHGPVETMNVQLNKRINDIKIIEALKKTKIGVIGRPSDWLISSQVDYKKVKERWGVSIIDIKIEELLENIMSVSQDSIDTILPEYSNPSLFNGVGTADIKKALRIYLGLKKTILTHQLTAFTLRCFDLLEPLDSTGCLALALLNDEGVPAGCEGDIPSLFTMIINNLITGSASFMSNPSQIQEGIITFAHCTVPLSMIDSFTYQTHFETGIGVGIAGKFNDGWITISKIGGSALENFYVDEGLFKYKPFKENLCRTQITIKPNKNMDYFLNNPLGNHHIITRGQYMERITEVMTLFKVSLVSN